MEPRLGQGQVEEPQAKLPLRMQMYDYVQRHPAAHILEIAAEFRLTHPTVMYHLAVLDDEGYVLSTIWGKRRVHFDTQGHFTVWEREILAILALDEARAILDHVATRPGTFPREIARELRISDTTVKRYVPELLRLHVLQEEEGSFRRRLRVSRSFKKRGLALLDKLPADARPAPYLEAIVRNEDN
jgi:predicted transcriptional regulator